jgi:hypothetical protein
LQRPPTEKTVGKKDGQHGQRAGKQRLSGKKTDEQAQCGCPPNQVHPGKQLGFERPARRTCVRHHRSGRIDPGGQEGSEGDSETGERETAGDSP